MATSKGKNAFEQAFQRLDAEEQEEYASAFEGWNAEQKLAAHVKYLQLQQLRIEEDRLLSLVLDDLEEDGTWASTYALLGSLRTMMQGIVNSELSTVRREDKAAIEKFNASLSREEQQRVARTILHEAMESFATILEEEFAPIHPAEEGAFRWVLSKVDKDGKPGECITNELHGYLEDEWIELTVAGEEEDE